MNSFKKRKDAFEGKFARDAELQFKAEARRNRLLAAWAAKRFGLSGSMAEDYAKKLIRADFTEPGDNDVFLVLKADFKAHGIDDSDAEIRRKMDECLEQAIGEIQGSQ